MLPRGDRAPRARARPAAAPLARAVPVRQLAGDARGDVRRVDRAHRPVRAGGLPPGVRRRALAGGPRLRADRGRGLRDAPRGGAARRRAALDRASGSRPTTSAAAASPASRDVAGDASSASDVFDGERALERRGDAHAQLAATPERGRGGTSASSDGARRAMKASARLPADRHARRAHAGAARGPDARGPHRGRRDRQRRSGAVLGPPAAAPHRSSRARCARTSRSWRRRSSWRAGVPWSTDGSPPAPSSPDPSLPSRATRASGSRR